VGTEVAGKASSRRSILKAEISKIRILAVDDHPVVRQGIACLIGIQSDMILLGEASNGREAIQQFRTHHPEVS
jgi:chemotaxis response regulator CheB